MPLEDKLDLLIAAVDRNTAALSSIVNTAGKRADAPATTTAAAGREEPGKPAGGRRARGAGAATSAPVDENGAKMEAFKAKVVEWMNWDDPAATEDDAKKEREDRKTFIIGVSAAFGVERASLIAAEHHDKVLDALEKFGDGDDINPASLAPQRSRR